MMPSLLSASPSREFPGLAAWWARCRTSEQIAICFFCYTAVLGVVLRLPLWQKTLGLALPGFLLVLVQWESIQDRRWSPFVREWLLPGIVLGGYWQMGWFAHSYDHAKELLWVGVDRQLLEGWGLRALLESGGGAGAWLVEWAYLMLYAIPPVCLGLLYWRGERGRAERYLVTFAAGTLAVYALLPLIPVESPRTVFAGLDVPQVSSLWRGINIWILDHMDIATSVFPSGHVAVAFSSAFGMWRAVPHRPRIYVGFFAMAILVYLATVYGRYHYAVDGLASLAICSLTTWVVDRYDR